MSTFNVLATGYGQDLINQLKRLADGARSISDGLSSLNTKVDEPEPLSYEAMAFEIYRDLLKARGPEARSNDELVMAARTCARSAYALASIFVEAGKKSGGDANLKDVLKQFERWKNEDPKPKEP
jgi:hypothetical protein